MPEQPKFEEPKENLNVHRFSNCKEFRKTLGTCWLEQN